jgi:hypothetical protein
MRMDCRTVGVVMLANDGEIVIVQVVDCKCGREFCDWCRQLTQGSWLKVPVMHVYASSRAGTKWRRDLEWARSELSYYTKYGVFCPDSSAQQISAIVRIKVLILILYIKVISLLGIWYPQYRRIQWFDILSIRYSISRLYAIRYKCLAWEHSEDRSSEMRIMQSL